MDPDVHASKAALRDVLTALVKLALAGDGAPAAGWRAQTAAARTLAAASSTPPVLAAISLDDLWSAAVKRAEGDAAVTRNETVNPTLPVRCPFSADDLLSGTFDVDRAVATIRDAASFG